MKQCFVFTLGLLMAFAFSSGVWAVEKKEKKAVDQKVQVADSTKAKSPDAAAVQKPKKKKYDDFVDLNKNGIDDRCESRKLQKEKAALEKSASSTAKAPSETKKTEKADVKKEEPKEKKPK
ncbi:MAG: hypothetical protein ACREBV_10710 [Candidatus Zixiibacteriota bacterium]